MDAKDLLALFGATEYTFKTNMSDVTHDLSLQTHKNGGSSINFLVEHMLWSRQRVLELLGLDTVIDRNELAMYAKGDEFDPDKALPIDDLQAMMTESFSRMKRGFVRTSQESLDEMLPEPFLGQKVTRGRMIGLFSFHESYHMGQIGILRRVFGLPGMIKVR